MHPFRSLALGIAIMCCAVCAGTAGAQPAAEARAPWHSGNYFGVAAQTTFPRSLFDVDYQQGLGLQGLFNYPLIPLLDLSGSLGWNHFPRDGEDDGIDIWELAFGARFALGVFFMNGEVGYFSQIDQSSFIPGLGVRLEHWEFSLRSKVAGSDTWSTFRVGYYF